MRKVHRKVILDIYTLEEEDFDIDTRIMESSFIIDPENDALDEGCTIYGIEIDTVEVIDSK